MLWVHWPRILGFGIVCTGLVGLIFWFCNAILVSLLLSLFLCYLIAPVLTRLEKKLSIRRVPLVLCAISLSLLFIVVLLGIFLPLLYREGLVLLRQIPQAFKFLAERLEPLKSSLAESGFVSLPRLEGFFESLDVWGNISARLKTLAETLIHTTPDFLSALVNLGLMPVLSFFILVEFPRLRSEIVPLIPTKLKEPLRDLVYKIDSSFKAVLKGQLIVAAILTLLYMAGLSLIQLESGLAIGFVAGICRIIPYLDVLVGLSLSLIAVVTSGEGLGPLVLAAVVFALVQALDAMVVTPRVIGGKAGLHPGIVIVSVICFGNRFGFWGVLIAIPCLAIAKVIGESLLGLYKDSPLFRD